jgi:hypothetical protein
MLFRKIKICKINPFLLGGVLFIIYALFPSSAYAWKYVVAGDTRSGHSAHRKVISSILNKVPNSQRVTYLNSGDVTANGNASEWQVWADIVTDLNINWSQKNPPQYIGALGNHDNGSSGWLSRWKQYLPAQIGLSAYSGISGNSDGLYGSVKYDNAIFIWVDSTTKPSGQEAFLRDTLVKAKNDTQVVWKFVMFHHPPIPCGSKSDWSLGKTWHDNYFVPNGVDIVWLGHAHYYERTCPITKASSKTCDTQNRGTQIGETNGVIHVVAGGGGAGLYGMTCFTQACSGCPFLEKGAKRHHFVEVDIQGNKLTAKVWDTDSSGAPSNPTLIEQFSIQKGGPPGPTSTPTKVPTATPPDTGVPGDADGNQKVDIADYAVWLNNYKQSKQGSQYGDFNNSGKVDGMDYIIWLNNYGT